MNILLVEDDVISATLLTEKLKRIMPDIRDIHHVVTMAGALDFMVARGKELDLVFLDLRLPDSQNWEDTCDNFAPFARLVPVIVMTGESDHGIAVQLLRHGYEDYIVKGSQKHHQDLLKETIDFALARHRMVGRMSAKINESEQCIQWLSGGYSVQ